MILSIIVTISALLFCRLLQIWLKYRFHPVPCHPWPIWKDENAKVVRDSLQNGSLPKILRPEMFPFSSYSKSYIFTDLEVIKEAFVHKELCHRDSTEESRIDNQYDQEYIGLDKLAVEELGQEDTLIKNGPGNFVGMGDGPYDEVHKLFRTGIDIFMI
jgi:hypothetical protein